MPRPKCPKCSGMLLPLTVDQIICKTCGYLIERDIVIAESPPACFKTKEPPESRIGTDTRVKGEIANQAIRDNYEEIYRLRYRTKQATWCDICTQFDIDMHPQVVARRFKEIKQEGWKNEAI